MPASDLTDLVYQSGFGNHLASEAVAGALPPRGNAPRRPAFGLFAEQLNGTGFTVQRASNLRTWMYRLRPAIHPGRHQLVPGPAGFRSHFDQAVVTPEPMRFRPLALPQRTTDWLDGMHTFAGAGSPTLKQGMAIHLYAATADMDRVFVSLDGDLLLAPQLGRLRVQTELGWLQAGPGELLLLPRGLRFRVALPDGEARGFVAELYEGHFRLPERGLIGANGLADERHFLAPVAAYEDRPEDTTILTKSGGRFWQSTQPHSPFDVVAWHGRYAPFKYDLRSFMSYGSVSFDHPDPSVLTVLTAPHDDHGRNVIDVGAFLGRWDVTEDTFRPPYFHRNSAVEFNAVISSSSPSKGYPPGAYSFTPYLAPHGVAPPTHAHASRADDTPHRIPDDSVWLQFESTYLLGVLPEWLAEPHQDLAFLDQFQGYETGELVD